MTMREIARRLPQAAARGWRRRSFNALAQTIPPGWRLSTLCEPLEINRMRDRRGALARWSATLSCPGNMPAFGAGSTPVEALAQALDRLKAHLA